MLALAREEDEPRNSRGVLMRDALDPKTQWEVSDLPTVDFSEQALALKQRAYYTKYDTDPKNPLNRAGHLWGISKAE